MKQLSNYLKVNNAYNNIDESLNNNIRIINESQLVIEHGKDIDSLLQKFGQYTYNSLYNQVNESAFNFKLTLNESITARDFFIFICEDYKEALLEELNIYEQYIKDTLEINEGIKNSKIYQNVVGTLKQGKEKTLQAYNDIKTKIKEVNQIIKDFANKTIKSVKEMANRLMDLLEKFNCTIKQLFEKIGFKINDEEIDAIGADLAKNPDTVKGNDIYDFKSETNESFEVYGQQLINEEIEEEDPKDKEKTVQQAEKKGVKGMLWSAFKQFLIWASVCVVIPGIVCAVFPGTFIALLVPLACKLAWNGYKIVKMWKQWQKVRKEWNTYGKAQKWITVIGMIASIIALAFNFNSLIGDGGKILSAFSKTGCDLLGKANLGIQPDVLTRGFAAFVKMISEGKFSMNDFGSAFKEITDSFAEHTQLITEKVVKATAKIGKSADDVFGEYTGSKFKTSTEAWTKFLKPNGIPIDKVPKGAAVDVVLDGSSASKGAGKLIKFLSDNGYDVGAKDALNGSLNKICKNAGSIWSLKGVPVDLLQKAQDAGIELGHNGWFSILGGVADASKTITTITDVVTAATSMLVTIPSVEYAFQNNGGFQVRLGTEKENFVYEVGKDGVKKEAASDYTKEYEKITNIIKDTNNKYYKQLEKELKEEDSDKKKEIEDNLKKFQKNFENINNEEVIIFYGKKISEKKNESLLSLYDYIIKEAEDKKSKYSIDDIKQNFIDLKNLYLTKIGEENNKVTGDQKKGDFKGNTKMILDSIFTLNEKSPTSKFVYDENYKYEPYELIKQRVNDDNPKNDVFGPKDIELLAVHYCIWKGPDNEESYKAYRDAFIDAAILKGQFMKNENEDIIFASYKKLIDHLLSIKDIANEVKDKEWEPKKEWAPLKIDESDLDSKIVDKVENTEKNDNIETSKKDAEDELEKIEAPLPADSEEGSKDDNKKKESSETEDEDTEEQPILMIAHDYVIDLSNSDNSGPRKEIFTLKNISDNYEFIEIKKGTSKENLSIMLGSILNTQTEKLRGYTILNPCDDKDGDNFKTIGDENTEREDFGKLTNGEITDILNKPKNAKKYIFNGSSKSIAQNEDDKKYKEKKKKEYEDKLKNADEETINTVKEIDPDAIDKDGKIKQDKIKEISDKASSYKLAQYKSKDTEKGGGLWSKLKNFVKGLFGSNKKEGKKYNKLLNHIDPDTNENLNEYNNLDLFLEEMFKSKSLSEYIIERKL